ncbi:MAG TPA: T9SS type A sorting domain-containing protein [Bacteroidia bacterium]|nr:T9SS type A sorting domain-containing protein [Bacteroidia bacterium]
MKNVLKKLALVAFLFCISGSMKAQVMYEWSNAYDGGNADRALLVAPEGNNFIHVAGTTETASGIKLYTQKYRTDGILKWSRQGNTVIPGTILFLKRDAAFSTYFICTNPSGGYLLIKYGVDAHEKWRKSFTETPAGFDIRGNKLYTGGQGTTGFFARCYRTTDGHINWTRTETNGQNAMGFDIDNSGNVYVGGATGISLDETMYIVKFRGTSVSPVWTINYPGDESGRDNVHKLVVDAVGNVYASGEIDAYGSMMANISMAKFNSSGIFQWKHYISRAGGPVVAWETNLIVDAYQNPILTGIKSDFYNINPNAETSRIFVIKLNRSTGAELFFSFPNDPTTSDPNIDEGSVSCSLDQYGNIYVGGYGNQGGSLSDLRWTITKLDGMTGIRSWIEAGYSFTGGSVNDVYVSSAGDVYLALHEHNTTVDFMIEKFSQPGGGLRKAAVLMAEGSAIVFPNPSADRFTLRHSFTENPAHILLLDLSGKIVATYTEVPAEFTFGENIAPGVYYLELISGETKQTFRLVKTTQY